MFQLKILPIIIFFLISIIGLQPILGEWKIPSQISSNTFVDYENSKIGYKIKYPDNWNKLESINNTIFYPPLKQEETKELPSTYLKIANTSLPNIPLTLDSIVDETLKNLNATTDSFKLIESNNILLHGNKDVNKLVYSYKQLDNIIKTMDVGFFANNNLILISYVSDLENYARYLPTIDKMIESIQTFTASQSQSLDFDKGTIKVDNSIINVEIAESDSERQRWLMFREDKFPSNSGMILVYPKSDLYALWLLNIQYNLDIMWFNEKGNLVYMIKDAKPCENPLDPHNCTYKTTVPAKYIVVSTEGFIKRNNITNTSKMIILLK